MSKFHYTTLAHRYTARYPVLTYVGTQVNFWIIANLLLLTILYLQSRLIAELLNVPPTGSFMVIVVIGVGVGIAYGSILGITGHYLEGKFLKNKSLGRALVIKWFASFAVLFIIFSIVRYTLYERFMAQSLQINGTLMNEYSWKQIFRIYVLYYFFMTLLISFINQVNKKYGPGVLIPLLLGRYRQPREEERVFVFMDLKSSTTIAEKLGHLKYSAFIRDCFSDINEVLYPYRAQVYQYVGDEIVVTWQLDEGIKNHFCIEFFFACREQFRSRSEFYMNEYGQLPEFKASVHAGPVTAVEIGEVKRDIAYHGDTLNTAARIQSLCNEYGRSFLASEYIINRVGTHPGIKFEELGEMLLRGKTEALGVFSVERSLEQI